jgi:glycosyltransferase involved in cell wall biosynthesis
LPTILYHVLKNRPSIIYSYKGFLLGPWVASKLTGIPWVIDLRTAPTGQGKEWISFDGAYTGLKAVYWEIYDVLYRLTLPDAFRVVTLSEELKAVLSENYDVPADDIVLVPLGVDTDLFDPKRFKSASGDSLDLVYIGSIRRFRGFEVCFEGLARSNAGTDVRIHMVGTGNEDDIDKLKKQTRCLEVANQIEWYGYVDHKRIPKILSKMDLAISPLPAHESYEVSSPAKLYEYLAMGLPVICSDITPHRKIFDEGVTGYFFEPGDSQSFGETLNEVLDKKRTVSSESRKAARQVAEKYSWESRLRPVHEMIKQASG